MICDTVNIIFIFKWNENVRSRWMVAIFFSLLFILHKLFEGKKMAIPTHEQPIIPDYRTVFWCTSTLCITCLFICNMLKAIFEYLIWSVNGAHFAFEFSPFWMLGVDSVFSSLFSILNENKTNRQNTNNDNRLVIALKHHWPWPMNTNIDVIDVMNHKMPFNSYTHTHAFSLRIFINL